jgi:hypothetical protein
MGEGDGQLAAGSDVAEEDTGRCGATFFAEVEALQDCGNVFGNGIDGERAAVDEENDDGLAGGLHGFDEIVLRAEEVERVAIA